MRILSAAALALAACAADPGDPGTELPLPAGFPAPVIPAANAYSADKAELGRHLFYDPRISGNGTQSCADCHQQERAFSDGRAVAVGSTGEAGALNAPTLGNAAYATPLGWAHPGLSALEDQLLGPMLGTAPIELGMSGREAEIMARLAADPALAERFAIAYPEVDPAERVSFGRTRDALATFVRTLMSGDSAFDQFLAGDRAALSPGAQRGADLFYSDRLGCATCHAGFNFTAATRYQGSADMPEEPMHNTGLYDVDGAGAYPPAAPGAIADTGRPEDMGRFRVPSLRNVELTAPYMHDGTVAALDDVIRIYEAGGRQITDGPNAGDGRASPLKSSRLRSFTLDDGERADLLEFLRSLTDWSFVSDPRLADPRP